MVWWGFGYPYPQGDRVEIPSLLMLQVSNGLAFLYIYPTNTDKVDYVYSGQFLAGVDPSLRGG